MVTPTAGGLHIGGTVEMAGLDAASDWRRAWITVKHARKALPDLQVAGASECMRHRPALPDTVRVTSASGKAPGVYFVTGQSHLDKTCGATTVKPMGGLITGSRPPVDMTRNRIDRF